MVRESLKSDAELRAKAPAGKQQMPRTRYDDWAFALGRMVMHEITTAKKDGRPLAVIVAVLKSLQRASGTLAKCFEISSKALGMDYTKDGEDEIPNLVFGEPIPFKVAQLRKEDDEPDLIDDDSPESLTDFRLSGTDQDVVSSADESDGSV
ncbi:DNA-binding protein [Escherichia coli]|uniref:DNA-binding protein n=1 Tax=Escherichia coli TaxID=562 RepID=UPI003986CFEA